MRRPKPLIETKGSQLTFAASRLGAKLFASFTRNFKEHFLPPVLPDPETSSAKAEKKDD